MEGIYRLGIDLAKQNFELCGVTAEGRIILRKTLKRSKLAEFVAKLPALTVCMEACGGANFWARKFATQGHKVRLVPAQHVKAFLKSQKNDSNDALAITEAAARPTMTFVSPKTASQQDIQSMHRIRSRIVKNLGEVRNQLRGLLIEYGIVMPEGIKNFKNAMRSILETEDNELSSEMRDMAADSYKEYLALEISKKKYDERIEKLSQTNAVCKRLTEVPGVGAMTSTAFVSHIGDAGFYKNGRQAAASLGLVPRQHSTGGVQRLYGITKKGDRYLRSLLVHGARAYVSAICKKAESTMTPYEAKIKKMTEQKHINKVIVAVANRNARVLLMMIKSGESYKAA